MKKRYVLKKKVRFYAIMATLTFTICTLMFVSSVQGYKDAEYTNFTIKQGDTLWDIARENKGNIEIREYIYEICKINNIKSGIIFEGMEIKLPV